MNTPLSSVETNPSVTAAKAPFDTPRQRDDWHLKGQLEQPHLSPFAIRVRHLSHRYGTMNALRDVSFNVEHGQIFGFIGPNGAGKTTTIRVIATLYEPMAGVVEVDGHDVAVDPMAVRKVVGYMPDHAGVYDRITVREYLEFFSDAYRVPNPSVVQTVMELTDLTQIENRLVVQMSKGMKQRLQLARVLLHDPKILLLDEPASDLDPRARIEMRDLLLELRALGKTIMLSSHILTELADVCTSVAIMERGSIIVSGPIEEIAARLEQRRMMQAIGHDPRPAMLHPEPSAFQQQGQMVQPREVQQQAQMVQPGYSPAQVPNQQPIPPIPPQVSTQEPGKEAMQAAFAPVPTGAVDQPAPLQQQFQQHAPEQQQQQLEQVWTTAGGVAIPGAALKRLKIRVIGYANHAAQLLQGGPGIMDVQVISPNALIVNYQGSDPLIAKIVWRLVTNNIMVVGVEPERNELERIFLEVTQGNLQ